MVLEAVRDSINRLIDYHAILCPHQHARLKCHHPNQTPLVYKAVRSVHESICSVAHAFLPHVSPLGARLRHCIQHHRLFPGHSRVIKCAIVTDEGNLMRFPALRHRHRQAPTTEEYTLGTEEFTLGTEEFTLGYRRVNSWVPKSKLLGTEE